MGDGKWLINAQNGPQPSQPNMLYRVNQQTFDIIHANHKPITERLLQLYPESNFVNIVRSEVIDLENPIVDDKIKLRHQDSQRDRDRDRQYLFTTNIDL